MDQNEELKKYKPCPFCGEKSYLQLKYTVGQDIVSDKADYAVIRCSNCKVKMFAVIEREHYVPYEEAEHENCYRKIDTRYAENILQEKWNGRAVIEDDPEEIDLDPETGEIDIIVDP